MPRFCAATKSAHKSAFLGLALLVSSCATAPAPDPSAGLDAFLAEIRVAPASPAVFTAYCDDALARAETLKASLENGQGEATIATTFRQYDNLYNLISAALNDSALVQETNPSAETRAAGEACTTRFSAFATGVSLSRPIYDRLSAIVPQSADDPTRAVLARTLSDYRRAGVDRDEATRARVLALQNEITEIGLTFARNIREDASEVTFASPRALAGLPADYIAAHQPGPDGLIHITTQYPDAYPIFNYATNEDTRRRVYTAFRSRAFPQNEPVLRQLLEKRYELATLLGYPNYAALITEDKMIQTPARAAAFVDQLAAIARPAAQRDFNRQLARLRRETPRAATVPQWSTAYAQQLIRREDYNMDPQEVRRYFAYDNVRDGMLKLVEDLWGVDIRPWEGAPVWHESVQAYELYDGGQLIGRFFLDMHPRDGKYSHAAQFPLRYGVAGSSVPVGSLVCNFPAGDHTTGLMEHSDVETFLHEFGHLMHSMFAGQQQWAQQQYGEVEWDFIEAPSQLLEEWVWDYDTLAAFAKDADGNVIPRDLVEKMRAARFFGEGGLTMIQLGYATISLDYYNRDPAGIDLEDIYKSGYERYALSPFVQGSHPYASFGHLDGYSAIYYTYQWSNSIAADLFTQFAQNGLRDAATAERYRQWVLAPGGSQPAENLIESFLGRPMSLDAYRQRLEE